MIRDMMLPAADRFATLREVIDDYDHGAGLRGLLGAAKAVSCELRS